MKTTFKHILQLAILPILLLIGVNGWGQIISQYVETNSGTTPKGIEIWNNTGATLDFSVNNLIIQQGTNGAALSDITSTTISTGTLASGAVLVIGTTDIGTYLTNEGLTVTFLDYTFAFNGNDALAVKYGGTITDIFGNPGSDPGTAWTGGTVSTANQNIGLNSGITTGASAWTDPSLRFSTVSTTPASSGGLSGFGIAPVSTPTITTSTSTLTGFTYVEGSGSASAEQSFTVEGSNLTNDISIAPPTDYEISTGTGGSFSATNPITLTQSGGSVATTTIYVRLKAGLTAGTFNNEDITASSTGATNAIVTCSGYVTSPEPTNHATSFAATTASTTSSAITLTWADNDGAQSADGFLIKASDVGYGSITAPVDGTAEADATLVKNIAHGVQTVDFTGLTASTTYYFEIWPYTNSGSNIDYKTDGTIPQVSETTLSISLPLAWINEFHYDNSGTDANEFVEIALKNAGGYTLSNFTITLYNGFNGTSYDTKTLNNFTVGSTTNGITLYSYVYPVDGIQNGAPDGIALSYDDGGAKAIHLLEFISYEGTFIASGGPADGITSTDVVANEPGDASGTSISRIGPNNNDSWETYTTVTMGAANTTSGGTQTLPIELISFIGKLEDGVSKLQWATATEINNNYFTIERSDDAKNFYKIGMLQGAGNSNTIMDYSFVDGTKFSNTVYYRLKQTDFDGKFTYSNIISISEVTQDFVVNNIYASTANNLVINLYSSIDNQTDIQVINSLGQVVTNGSLEVSKGSGIYNFTIPNLAQGIYFIKINTNNDIKITKVKL